MPLLEETGYVPTEKYAHGPEILQHSRRIAKHYDLYRDALFHTKLTNLRWDSSGAVWILNTDRGDEFTAQFVALGLGPLNVPKLPGIPGLAGFRGDPFHTNRGAYAYTGGGPDDPSLPRVRDKTPSALR